MASLLPFLQPGHSPDVLAPCSNPHTVPPPGAIHVAAVADEEDRLAVSAALRERLRNALGGSDESLDLLLDLASGRLTYEEVGDHLGVERWWVWRLARSQMETIRWSLMADLAVKALAAAGGFLLDPRTGHICPRVTGARPVPGTTARFKNPSAGLTVGYLRRYRKRLLSESRPLHYFGGWENTTEGVFEYCLLWSELDDAPAAVATSHNDLPGDDQQPTLFGRGAA
jgi:hypothetical protein